VLCCFLEGIVTKSQVSGEAQCKAICFTNEEKETKSTKLTKRNGESNNRKMLVKQMTM